MTEQPEALRLADILEKMPLGECDTQAAAELRRLHELNEDKTEIIAALSANNQELLEALHHISLCSQNSMSSQRQCGEIARAAIAKHGGEA